MKLLLDTNIWLWAALDPDRIGKRTATLLVDPEVELWLSPLSVSEFIVLHGKRRFPGIADRDGWLRSALTIWPMRDAPLTRDIAMEAARFELPQRDPADRLLVATARTLGLKLATADRAIIASGAVAVIPND